MAGTDVSSTQSRELELRPTATSTPIASIFAYVAFRALCHVEPFWTWCCTITQAADVRCGDWFKFEADCIRGAAE
jgi:hypothetical protein